MGHYGTYKISVLILLLLLIITFPLQAKILIPMDLRQSDHLKAYGVAYSVLETGQEVEWLLNYRGGSFLTDDNPQIERICRIRGVSYENISGSQAAEIYRIIESENMETVLLEKSPKVAVYAPPPPAAEPWDDAVRLALEYAQIPYERVYDDEVLQGRLFEYDWVHLHHEDFTGQYGKFYGMYRSAEWYIAGQALQESIARRLGFKKVSKLKLAVVQEIKEYVHGGGFMFAMCSATDSYDIALSAVKTDICAAVFDGDPIDPNCQNELDYSHCFVFEGFTLITDPLVYEFSDIDTTPRTGRSPRGDQGDYFTLFDFSAKYDPVPCMLTQCHTSVVKGFMGQTTGYKKSLIKKSVVIMGEVEGADEVKYLHSNYGDGTFTFFGGHDPEDYRHLVGDPPTQLNLYKNSPGYRLILNNVLFPAAKKKKLKT
ncbi:asparagine synthetase B [bacterium]|nr:asparagine synthetase B [FCB group bacterium]MBL7191858.1 asparagine synthetase B [bacterium]